MKLSELRQGDDEPFGEDVITLERRSSLNQDSSERRENKLAHLLSGELSVEKRTNSNLHFSTQNFPDMDDLSYNRNNTQMHEENSENNNEHNKDNIEEAKVFEVESTNKKSKGKQPQKKKKFADITANVLKDVEQKKAEQIEQEKEKKKQEAGRDITVIGQSSIKPKK